MVDKEEQETNHGLSRKRPNYILLFSLVVGVLFFGPPTVAIGSFVWFSMSTGDNDIGWNRIDVDSFKKVELFSVGQREIELSVGTYEDLGEETHEVGINVSSGTRQMPTLKHRYSTDLAIFPPSRPGVYRLKDVDGDRQKDFVIRMGEGESNHRFYYISSQDGKGYQTDRDFQSSQPWVPGKPHW